MRDTGGTCLRFSAYKKIFKVIINREELPGLIVIAWYMGISVIKAREAMLGTYELRKRCKKCIATDIISKFDINIPRLLIDEQKNFRSLLSLQHLKVMSAPN